jgi:hypothetical protein
VPELKANSFNRVTLPQSLPKLVPRALVGR